MGFLDDNGTLVDATFTVEELDGQQTLVFESRGPSRNTEYGKGLTLVLKRLARAQAKLLDAAVESRATDDLALNERRLQAEGVEYPVALALVSDIDALRKALGRAQAGVGRTPNARGGGNPTKRIRLYVETQSPLDNVELVKLLSSPSASPGAVASPPSSQALMPLELVGDDKDIHASLKAFNDGAGAEPSLGRSLLRATSYWVYDPDEELFGPCKFVGFKKMDFPRYVAAKKGKLSGARFDGHVSQKAISKALGQSFEQDSSLSEHLRAWAVKFVGVGARDGIDEGKWSFVTLTGGRRYWAIVASPKVYDVVRAAQHLDTDLWTAPRGDFKPGDRVAFWRAKGADGNRGVVALGEVLTEPKMISPGPESLPYWVGEPDTQERRRIRVRYVVPPGVPLWLSEDNHDALKPLSVARATGGGVYKIKPREWWRLVQVLGGWPEQPKGLDDPEIQKTLAEASQAALEQTYAKRRGQGFTSSPERRKAIEMHAMKAAKAHFKERHYQVEDTSSNKPYDLVVTKGDEKLYVEVKGTSTAGGQVVLTKNEVKHAREHAGQMVLFILHGIEVEEVDGEPVAKGGVEKILWPWDVDSGDLTALQFMYQVPTSKG